MSVWTKLAAIQTALKAPKGQENKFGGYRYRSCEDILEAVKPLLAAQGAVVQLSDTLELVGQRYYIKATASLIDTDTGEATSVTAWAREAESRKGMDDSQVTGSASSYARKYALNGLLAIDDTRDADAMDNSAVSGLSKPQNKALSGRSRGQAANNQAAAKKLAEGLKSGSGTDAALKAAQQQAKAARQAYIEATGADPADVDAALKTVKGATWHTAEGCKIIFDTIAYWQANGK